MSAVNTVRDSESISRERQPVLSLYNVSKYFGGVQALDNVSLDIFSSEVIALVGDNGAGKSTFLKIISGVNIPDSGYIEMDGKQVHIHNERDASNLQIQTVYQDLALCNNMNAVQNIFLGRELRGKTGRLKKAEMEAMSRSYLNRLGIDIGSLTAKVEQLSGGQRQIVAIARSLLGKPRILLLDEPLANLGVIQRRQVGVLIKQLRSQGFGVVVVSHDLLEVFEVADRVIVFRLGKKAAEISRDEITHKGVVAEITGSGAFEAEDGGNE
jgi:D-xylose transport system ATP-binding protein